MPRFARFAWGLLAYDVAVVAWGAFVRATGSGAGCGRHWPTCNGDIVPHAKRIDTLIEVSHRLSSGTAFVLTAVLLVWAFYVYPKGHRIRGSAVVAMALMAGEALIGAGLVLFELVAHDASMTRALSMSVHLVSTFLLLASMTLTAWWASGGHALDPRGQRAAELALAVPLAGMLVVGASGAVTALGDTLFPSASVAAGLAQDFAPGAHLFVKLRAIHPVLAVATAVAIVVATSIVRALRPTHVVELASRAAAGLAIAQVCAGLLDVAMRAPVWMQLVHLILADCVWIALVLTTATCLARPSTQASVGEAAKPRRRQEIEGAGSGL
jgi:heme A synthase